ncbi:MAG: glycosyltransferase family 1 protein [bacterium]
MSHKGFRIGIDIRKIDDYGIGTYIQNLLNGLPYDNNITYLFLGNDRMPIDKYIKKNTNYRQVNSKSYSFKELITIPYIAYSNNLDLLHVPHYVVSPFTPHRIKVIVTIHDIIHLLFPKYFPFPLAYYYAKVMLSLVSKRANKIITVSEYSKQDMVKHLRISPNKIEVIYNGLDPVFCSEEKKIKDKRACHPLIARDYLLYVGNFKPHKNLTNLIKSFNILYNTYSKNYDLILAGGNLDEQPDLKNLVRQYSLSHVVKSLGYISLKELPPLYSNATLFIYISLYEGFGFPPLEAMACGIPVIVSNRSSLPEIIGDAAVFVDPYNIENIYEGMISVLSSTYFKNELVAKGKKRAEKFSWKEMSKKVVNVYESTLFGHGNRL